MRRMFATQGQENALSFINGRKGRYRCLGMPPFSVIDTTAPRPGTASGAVPEVYRRTGRSGQVRVVRFDNPGWSRHVSTIRFAINGMVWGCGKRGPKPAWLSGIEKGDAFAYGELDEVRDIVIPEFFHDVLAVSINGGDTYIES